MKFQIKKVLCIICSLILIFSMFAGINSTVSAAGKTNAYSNYIKYRGQDLKNTYAKLSKGENVNVLYYGGSVTEGFCSSNASKYSWRALVGSWIAEKFPNANVNNINVSYGGTSSLFGSYRLNEDVLSHDPDLIFIEFSINDYYDNQIRSLSKEEAARRYETIVRNLLTAVPDCDIITILTTEQGCFSINKQGELHAAAQAHDEVSAVYNIPSIYIGSALVNSMKSVNEWSNYMADIVHPSDAGYRFYADVIIEYLSNCLLYGGYNGQITNHTLPRQIYEFLLDGNVTYIDADESLMSKSESLGGRGFSYNAGASVLSGFPGGLVANNGVNSKFVVEFTGTELTLVQHSNKIKGYNVSVDNKPAVFVKFYDIKPEILVTGLEPGKHVLSLQPVYQDGVNSGLLFWIMGFYSRDESKATAKYDHAKHIYSQYVSNNDATCRVDGTKTAKCTVSGCDKVDTITDEGSKLAHKYETKVVEEATSTKEGKAEVVCSLCGRFDKSIVIPKGQTIEQVKVETTNKTEANKEDNNEETESVNSTTSGTTSSVITVGPKGENKKQEIPLVLKVILISVCSLLLIAIGILVFIIIKRKSSSSQVVDNEIPEDNEVLLDDDFLSQTDDE